MPDEIKFFEEHNKKHFTVRTRWPESYTGNAAEKLTTELLENNSQVHHFISHCDSSPKADWRKSLQFGRKNIKLSKLKAYHFEKDENSHDKLKNTLLFLNNCGSASITPLTSVNFPQLFIEKFGYKGFIGTEHDIPDNFACQFAKVFYAYFLKQGHLGMGLFRTRWFFAKTHHNPLGLFYTLYANPDIRLSRTVDSVNL